MPKTHSPRDFPTPRERRAYQFGLSGDRPSMVKLLMQHPANLPYFSDTERLESAYRLGVEDATQ